MVQRMTMAWAKWLGCAGLLLLLSGPVMAAEGVLEILAAGDVLLGGRMLEAPQAGELFGPLTRRRLEQADIFLWNCEIAGLSSVSKQNTFVFHADGLLFPQMAFANGAACTANNHVFDGLEEGATNLMAVLEGARFRHNGLHDRGIPVPFAPTRAAGLSADGIAHVADRQRAPDRHTVLSPAAGSRADIACPGAGGLYHPVFP